MYEDDYKPHSGCVHSIGYCAEYDDSEEEF